MFGSKRAQYFGFNPMLRETCEYMFQIVVMVSMDVRIFVDVGNNMLMLWSRVLGNK